MDQPTGEAILSQLVLLNAMGSAVCWAGLSAVLIGALVAGVATARAVSR